MEAITLKEEQDEYDFLIKYICTGKSTEELCEMASEEGLDPDKISKIIDYLMGHQYITTFDHSSLHDPSRFGETPIMTFGHECTEIQEVLKQMKQKNLI